MDVRRSVSVVAVAAVSVLAGCGGGKSSGSNGLNNKTAQQILDQATAALGRVKSFHMSGTITDNRGPAQVSGDISLPGKVKLTLRQGQGQVEVVVVGADGYIKGNGAFWQSQSGTGPVAALLADKWVKAPSSATADFAEFLAIADPKSIGHCLVQSHLGTIAKAGTGKVGGNDVVVVENKGDKPGSSPGKIYIATTGPALPLRATQTAPKKPGGTADAQCKETSVNSATRTSDLTLSDYDKPVTIVAPKGALDLGKLGGGTGGTGA